jgi:hypothetical protein
LAGQGGNDSITIASGGSHTFATDAGVLSSNLSLTVDAGGVATFSATQHLDDLTVNGAASVEGAGVTLVTHALAIGGSGSLDLRTSSLIVDYSAVSPVGSWTGTAYDGMTGLIASGRNGGSWDGNGLRTSGGDAIHSLAVAEAWERFGLTTTETAVFANETVDGTSVIVRFTYGGDANLDGKLNVDDYGRIDSNIGLGTFGWFNGDFNLDGKVNVDDYGILDSNIGVQGPPL